MEEVGVRDAVDSGVNGEAEEENLSNVAGSISLLAHH